MNVLDARTQSHQLRKSQDYEVVIDGQGTNLAAPEPVQGQAFYPGGDAPKKEYTGTTMERTTEALGDLAQTTGSMGVGAVSGGLGFFGDVGSLIGGLASALFPGDQNRIEAATETMTKISETIGSERFLGMYRDFINNQADLSQEDKKMMLDAAEVGSFMSVPGAGVALAKGKDVIKEGVVKAGQAADARIAERAADTGVTLTAGADPMPAVDAAISAAGRAARRDPNDSAGDAMAQSQARYFETGKFEPPTAENPVSIVPPKPDEPGIIAFHGSGADFDEFRLEMIGTGEGAQAYGYGLYFTDSEDIAKYYKNTIANRDAMYGNLPIRYKGQKFAEFEDSAASEADPDKYRMINALGKEIHRLSYSPKLRTPENAKKQLLARLDNEIAQQRNAFKNQPADIKDAMEEAFIASLQRDKDALERIDIDDITIEQTGKMYKVGLAPKPDELLDYDTPLNQQPRVVQKLIKNLVGDLLAGEPEHYDRFDYKALAAIRGESPTEGYSPTGDDILTDLQRFLELSPNQTRRAAMDASQLLNDFGIPGLKYRAAGSRGAATADEAAERNYVIFDDKAVKILEKYGIVGPVAVTAAGASQTNMEAADGQDT
jgi:hypothetical protein